MAKLTAPLLLLAFGAAAWVPAFEATSKAAAGTPAARTRDVVHFLRRLRTVDHLPQILDGVTSLASTWDRSGGNADGTDYERIEGTTNVLLDVDGPGCIHRLFTGASEPAKADTAGYLRVDGTRLQVFLDHSRVPTFDFPVVDFFDPGKGPIPGPLAGGKAQGWTYPGSLMPIPYARHCRVQLVNREAKNWGSYWQIVYSTFPEGTPVESLAWPLRPDARAELAAVVREWRAVQEAPPPPPARWSADRSRPLAPGETLDVTLAGAGVVREMRVSVEPATPANLRGLRLLLRFDNESRATSDVPLGDFFGHTNGLHAPAARFSTLLLGVTADEAYSRFPMPFADGAQIALRNDSTTTIPRVRMALDVEPLGAVPSDWGRFRATHLAAPAADAEAPRFGPQQVPAHLVLEHAGAGKYVGVVMSEDWPHEGWWGEGDWLIWTDEEGWPPRYRGTGSEEYFNSGWCLFDRKAVSGAVLIHPGHPTQYSFHLDDAFPFRRNIRVAVETMGWDEADRQIRREHPVWRTTAFWYAEATRPQAAARGVPARESATPDAIRSR